MSDSEIELMEMKKHKGVKSSVKPKQFQRTWLEMEKFKNWLEPTPNDKNKCRCKVCNVELVCGLSELARHAERLKHINKMNARQNNKDINSFFKSNEKVLHEEQVKKAEVKLSLFFAEHNVATMVVDHLIPLLKEVFNDSKILVDVSLARTKCAEIINNVIGRHETDILVKHLQQNNFSVLVDESTDISEKKNLCLLVKYCDEAECKVKTNLLELINVDAKDCSAEKLYSAFKICLSKYNIPLNNVLGVASDGANVMIGHNNSFFSHLKNDVPHAILLKCVCHSVALVASKACEQLPRGPEDLIRNIGTYISGSARRSAILLEFQEYFREEQKKILKLATTRWLSRHQCIVRILDNWIVLENFFTLAVNDDKLRSAETILKDMRNVYFKAYLYFLKYSLNFLNSFNALFQSQNILIHQLYDSCNRLLLQLCSNYVKPEICYCKDLGSINLAHPDFFLDINKVKLGAECESYLAAAPAEVQSLVRKHCLAFYATAANEIQQRLPLSNNLFRSMKFIDPTIAFSPYKQSEVDLNLLANHFKTFVDSTKLCVEWQNLPSSFNEHEINELKTMSTDQMWLKISSYKNFNEEYLFPNLCKLAKIILTLPHSNADAERIFSIVTDLKTKKRNKMGQVTLNSMCVIRSSLQQSNKTCVTYPVDSEMLKYLNQRMYSFKN